MHSKIEIAGKEVSEEVAAEIEKLTKGRDDVVRHVCNRFAELERRIGALEAGTVASGTPSKPVAGLK